MSYVLVIIYKLSKNIIKDRQYLSLQIEQKWIYPCLLAKMYTKQGGGEIKWDFFLILKICCKENYYNQYKIKLVFL